MAGLYQRQITPETSSPGMTVEPSQGAGAGIPRGGVSLPSAQTGTWNVAQLGGLLGLFGRGRTGDSSGTSFNTSLLPQAGNTLALSPDFGRADLSGAGASGTDVFSGAGARSGALAALSAGRA